MRPHRLTVRTADSQSVNSGSIPGGVTKKGFEEYFRHPFECFEKGYSNQSSLSSLILSSLEPFV